MTFNLITYNCVLFIWFVDAGDIFYTDPKESDSILNVFENLLSGESVRNINEVHPVQADPFGNIFIKILAKPGAKSNKIIATKINRIGIKIAAPPVDGKANKELLKYLSKVLGVRKSALEIVEGKNGKLKTVRLKAGCMTLLEAIRKMVVELEDNLPMIGEPGYFKIEDESKSLSQILVSQDSLSTEIRFRS